jgi:hypothetical protein
MTTSRELPRPFAMHWGSGQIVEEATCSSEHKQPSIQLMEYDEGEAAGSWSVRFCYYSPEGRFQRGPMMIDEGDLDGLRASLDRSPQLKAILTRLVTG